MTDEEKFKVLMTPIVSVDFDGTLDESAWPDIGKPNTRLIQYLINCRKHGIKVILNTMREGELLDQAVKWCEGFGLTFDAANSNLPEMIELYGHDSRKISATYYIDDRNAIIKGFGVRLPDLSKYGKEKECK